MPRRPPLARLLAAVAWSTLANAAPADPTITPAAVLPRQADALFIGWIEVNSTWYSQNCDAGLLWYQNGDYAQCCPETATSCAAPTACVSGSQIYPLGSTTITTACTENYNNLAFSICNTALIFESFGDPNPKTDIVCGDESVRWNYYRKIPATATESKSSSPSGDPSSSSDAPSSSPSSLPQGEKSTSKAWIAGAVVGPIIGIALVAGIFFFMRRRKNKKTLPQAGGVTMGPPPGVSQPYTDAKPQMANTSAYAQTSGIPPTDPYNHQSYGQQPPTPAPQYAQPYDAPASPPLGGAYVPDHKQGFTAPIHPDAAELGDSSSPSLPAGQPHTAELHSDDVQRI